MSVSVDVTPLQAHNAVAALVEMYSSALRGYQAREAILLQKIEEQRKVIESYHAAKAAEVPPGKAK